MSTKTKQEITAQIAAALNERSRAKVAKPEDNPLHQHDLKSLVRGRGIAKSADLYPARNVAPGGPLGFQMEAARIAGIHQGKDDRSARRKAAARARAERKAQFDKIADSPVIPSAERMTAAWRVIVPLHSIITRIALGKQRWASRFLGSTADDIPQVALEKIALVLAKSDKDLDLLTVAADELGQAERRTGKLPGEQLSDEERKERKRIGQARKWLMGMVNNRVMGALVDSYLDQRNLRWDNIDLIATVMASISGVGDDPMIAHTKANRAPAFLGAAFARPGGVDAALLATAINAAITERGLDRLVELLLDDDNRRSDGAFRWADNAERVFLASPENGPWMWDLVVKATAHLEVPRRGRADAARTHVRNLFEWLPGFIVSTVESFDQRAVIRHEGRALMASGFDAYLPKTTDTRRLVGRPALSFATAEEAAKALVEHLGVLVTGNDYATSIAYA